MSSSPSSPTPGGPSLRPLPQPGLAGAGAIPAGQESATLDEANADASMAMGFWQHPFVQNVLPFLTSLMMHVGIIILGYATYKVVTLESQKVHTQIDAGQSVIDTTGMPEGEVPHPGLGGDPTRDPAQMNVPVVDAHGISDKESKDLTQTLSGGGSGDAVSSGLIGLGPNSSWGMGKNGNGNGRGEGTGTGDGSGGQLAPWGLPGGGGGLGRPLSFGGIKDKAQRIAFVCDASGSMMVKFDPLRVELRKAVEALRPPQSFQIIFFQETSCSPVDPKGLLFATPENKRRAFDFVDKTAPRGSTDPIPALDMAFKQGAELIFLLTDGDFPDNKAVFDELHKLNADHKVRVNTICFIDHDEEFEKVLKKMADENGGIMRFVSEEEVSK